MSDQKNNYRCDPTYHGDKKVGEVLPDYFKEEYPQFLEFLKEYYKFEDSDVSPSSRLKEIQTSRDITATSDDLLVNLEDELLLGQSYFEGFQNKRSAAKFSNYLYRSKGSLYSIEQFFKMFFNESPNVRYTKEDRFMLNDSLIGANSGKYIKDDKLYQVNAIQIRIGIPISDWREEYKLFVHPAGMYFAGQVEIESVATFDLGLNFMPDFEPVETNVVVQAEATMVFPQPFTDLTGIIAGEESDTNPYYRIDVLNKYVNYTDSVGFTTYEQLENTYSSYNEWAGTNSITFDNDSDSSDSSALRFSQDDPNLYTFDDVDYVWYDSDSA